MIPFTEKYIYIYISTNESRFSCGSFQTNLKQEFLSGKVQIRIVIRIVANPRLSSTKHETWQHDVQCNQANQVSTKSTKAT